MRHHEIRWARQITTLNIGLSGSLKFPKHCSPLLFYLLYIIIALVLLYLGNWGHASLGLHCLSTLKSMAVDDAEWSYLVQGYAGRLFMWPQNKPRFGWLASALTNLTKFWKWLKVAKKTDMCQGARFCLTNVRVPTCPTSSSNENAPAYRPAYQLSEAAHARESKAESAKQQQRQHHCPHTLKWVVPRAQWGTASPWRSRNSSISTITPHLVRPFRDCARSIALAPASSSST